MVLGPVVPAVVLDEPVRVPTFGNAFKVGRGVMAGMMAADGRNPGICTRRREGNLQARGIEVHRLTLTLMMRMTFWWGIIRHPIGTML